MYGQFPSVGDDQFISPKQVDAALARDPVFNGDDEIVLGVDVARFGSDKTVLAVRKGKVLIKTIKYQGLDTMEVTGKVIEAIREWKPFNVGGELLMYPSDPKGSAANVINCRCVLGYDTK